ncbi:MAG: ArnT family glycosyltransferase [Acidobacteriota bacterium]
MTEKIRPGKDGFSLSGLRVLLILLVFILPFAYLAYQACLNPEIEFLTPSWKAGWALHPVQEILNPRGQPVSREVVFKREFDLEPEVLPRLRLGLRFCTAAVVLLNGATVYASPPEWNWKSTTHLDLTPFQRRGHNILEVRVRNPRGLPALLVEDPSFLRTRGAWRAGFRPESGESRTVVSPLGDAPPEPMTRRVGADPGPLQRWGAWRWMRWVVLSWGVALVAMLIRVVLGRREGSVGEVVLHRSWPAWSRMGIPVLILGAALWLNLSNTARFPYDRSRFDWLAHVRYVQSVASNWRIPRPSDGPEAFQPPLYYFCAALAYRLGGGDEQPERGLKWVQYLSTVMGWGLALFTFLLVRRLHPGRLPEQWMALLFAAFLPMSLYMNPAITNEVFSATLIAAALYALVVVAGKQGQGWLDWGLMGLLAGLALLSKYTASFTALAAIAFLFLRAVRRRDRSWLAPVVYVTSTLLVAGVFYGGHLRQYGDPFVGNWDEQTGFHYEQNPGYRSPGFYLRFGAVFLHHPERAPWASWLDGNYASMWGDTFRQFLAGGEDPAYFWVSVTLLLATLPAAAMGLGFLRTLGSTWRQPDSPDFILLVVPVWTWLAIIEFSLEVPFASTVKAFFFLSLVPILGVYLARGRGWLELTSPWLRSALDVSLGLVAALSIWLYRYPG